MNMSCYYGTRSSSRQSKRCSFVTNRIYLDIQTGDRASNLLGTRTLESRDVFASSLHLSPPPSSDVSKDESRLLRGTKAAFHHKNEILSFLFSLLVTLLSKIKRGKILLDLFAIHKVLLLINRQEQMRLNKLLPFMARKESRSCLSILFPPFFLVKVCRIFSSKKVIINPSVQASASCRQKSYFLMLEFSLGLAKMQHH